MDYAAVVFAFLAGAVFLIAALKRPVNTAWGFLFLTVMFVCQFTTITDKLADW